MKKDFHISTQHLEDLHLEDLHLEYLHLKDLHLEDLHLEDLHLEDLHLEDLMRHPCEKYVWKLIHRDESRKVNYRIVPKNRTVRSQN